MRTATRHGLARFAVPAIFFVAALLRVSTLNERGVWRDEVYTIELVHLPFTKMMAAIRDTEGTPPLYYILAWAWARVAGSDPVRLRLLSALFGIGAVLGLFYAAATLVSRRAGLIAALLGATSPLLVWYSQEARAYTLGVLLITVSLWLTASIARTGTTSHSRLVAWAAVCGLALTVHYFTVFVVTAEAVWLVVVLRRQRRALSHPFPWPSGYSSGRAACANARVRSSPQALGSQRCSCPSPSPSAASIISFRGTSFSHGLQWQLQRSDSARTAQHGCQEPR